MQRSNDLKIVIDTNLWISFLISHRQDRLDHILNLKKASILFSVELLDEINATITKPKLKKHFGVNAMEDMLTSLDEHIDLIVVRSKIEICRDRNDNFLLALAKDGNADYLLTGDKDLLELNKIGKTKIVTFSKFQEDTAIKKG
jgi:putative PIN family toxin of toxin-antitoxin system